MQDHRNLYHDLTCYKRANVPVRPCPSYVHILTWLGAVAVTVGTWLGLVILMFTF